MMEWRRSHTGKSILPAFPNKLIGHSSGGVGGAVWFKKKKKKKRYLTESPSLILMPFGKISLTKRVFLSYVGNIEILSFLFHFLCRILPSASLSEDPPVSATYTTHSSLLSTSSTYPSLFFTTVFPWYNVCEVIGDTRFASTSVPLPSGKKKAASYTFCHKLFKTFQTYQDYSDHISHILSLAFLRQLPSHALGRRRWAQGIFNPTLWAILAFHPPSFFPGGKISTWVLAILAFLSSPSFHNLLPRRDCHFPFSPFQRGASQPPSAFLLPVAFFFLENKRSLPTFLKHYPRFCRRSLPTWETSILSSIPCSWSHQFERHVIHLPLRSSFASNLESCVAGIELAIIVIWNRDGIAVALFQRHAKDWDT